MSAVSKYPSALGYAGLRMTADEYLALGETREQYELIDGVVFMSPSPGTRHQKLARRLLAQLDRARDHMPGLEALPDIDVQLTPGLVYRPDVVVYAPGRLTDLPDRLTLPPDLIIEILSPGSESLDLVIKKSDYGKFGVAEYWVIDPQDVSVRCWRRAGGKWQDVLVGGDEIHCQAIRGLSVDLAPIRRAMRRA